MMKRITSSCHIVLQMPHDSWVDPAIWRHHNGQASSDAPCGFHYLESAVTALGLICNAWVCFVSHANHATSDKTAAKPTLAQGELTCLFPRIFLIRQNLPAYQRAFAT